MKIQSTRFLIPVLVFVTILFSSCHKADPVQNNNENHYTAGDAINIDGVIMNADGLPLQAVVVNAGNKQVTTAANGSFHITDAVFTTSETFITATAPGFFKGSRTFFADKTGNNFIKLRLLPRTELLNFSAATGGTFNIDAGQLTLPANAFQLQVNAADYNGTVSVKAVYLDPADPLIYEKMPGDLRGISTNNDIKGLRTFGMVNVEFEGTGSQLLQLKPGMTATIQLPVPASLATVAPATIPLWYFDESKGLWKEEGAAQKNGAFYTGTVSHFTFWNIDDPFPYVQIQMKVINTAGQGIQGAAVELTSLSDSAAAYDLTDINGNVDGYVPANVQLRRDIYNECGDIVHTSLIGPFSATTDLGSIQVGSLSNQQTITGTVNDCNNLPVTNGYVIITAGSTTFYSNIVSGSFTAVFTNCNASPTATLVAINQASSQQSNPVSLPLSAATVDAGMLQACGTSANEFMTITVDGVTKTWQEVAPYELFAEEDPAPNAGIYDLYLGAYNNDNGNFFETVMGRSQDSTNAPFGTQVQYFTIYDQTASIDIQGDYFLDNSIVQTPVSVLTAYGPVGEFITGNFSGRFIRNDLSVTDTVDVLCSFRLRRR